VEPFYRFFLTPTYLLISSILALFVPYLSYAEVMGLGWGYHQYKWFIYLSYILAYLGLAFWILPFPNFILFYFYFKRKETSGASIVSIGFIFNIIAAMLFLFILYKIFVVRI